MLFVASSVMVWFCRAVYGPPVFAVGGCDCVFVMVMVAVVVLVSPWSSFTFSLMVYVPGCW